MDLDPNDIMENAVDREALQVIPSSSSSSSSSSSDSSSASSDSDNFMPLDSSSASEEANEDDEMVQMFAAYEEVLFGAPQARIENYLDVGREKTAQQYLHDENLKVDSRKAQQIPEELIPNVTSALPSDVPLDSSIVSSPLSPTDPASTPLSRYRKKQKQPHGTGSNQARNRSNVTTLWANYLSRSEQRKEKRLQYETKRIALLEERVSLLNQKNALEKAKLEFKKAELAEKQANTRKNLDFIRRNVELEKEKVQLMRAQISNVESQMY